MSSLWAHLLPPTPPVSRRALKDVIFIEIMCRKLDAKFDPTEALIALYIFVASIGKSAAVFRRIFGTLSSSVKYGVAGNMLICKEK
jgi:hypothetical protein